MGKLFEVVRDLCERAESGCYVSEAKPTQPLPPQTAKSAEHQ